MPGKNLPANGLGFVLAPAESSEPGDRYLMRTPLGAVWLTGDAIWLTSLEAQPGKTKSARGHRVAQARRGVNVKITFPRANAQAQPVAEQQMDGSVSYLQGPDPAGWASGLPRWGAIRYPGLYPGVDLLIRSTAQGFTWAYVLQPGADASALRLRVQGVDGLKSGASGAILQTAAGEIHLPPLELEGDRLSLNTAVPVPPSEKTDEMTILPTHSTSGLNELSATDPFIYSTFLGGTNWDAAYDIAMDGTGAAYLVGETASTNFPITPGAFDATMTQTDVFALKMLPHGSGLSYATYIGGNNMETGWSVAVENSIAYIGGETWSTDFPVTDASNEFQGEEDAFIVALNAAGTGLVYSRLLGGREQDQGFAIAVQSGCAYLTGFTYSNNFPGGGYTANGDVFVVKLNANGTVNYSRLAGGNQEDAGFSIAVSNGAAWVTGETWSTNFTSTNYGNDDVFILGMSASGSVASKRSYGGANEEYGTGIALDSYGNIFVTGTTSSTDFPFTEGTPNGLNDVFLLKVDSSSSQPLYAAPLGGSGSDEGKALALDSVGAVVVVGLTQSANFPVTTDAYQAANHGSGDAFMTRFLLTDDSPGHRVYSSFLGGTGYDEVGSVALDSSAFVYLAGQTQSADFPTTSDGLYRTLLGMQDAFFTVIDLGPIPKIAIRTTTNNEDADNEPGVFVRVGDLITWGYEVTNTGKPVLTNVRVTDNRGVIPNCPKTSLAAGEKMQCTASGTAIRGQYSNIGSVSAKAADGKTIESADASHYFGSDPKIELVKKTNGADANTVPGIYVESGRPVVWTYEVSNTGNVDLTGLTVVDNNGTPGSAADDITVCAIAELAAGAVDSTTCHLDGLAGMGQYTNTAVVSADAPGSLGTVTDSDPSSYFGSLPSMTLVKKVNDSHVTAAPGPNLLAGSTVTWKYVVENTGNVTLTGVSVIDDNGTPGVPADDRTACSGIVLAPGAAITCTLNGTATAGEYHNIAIATGTPPAGSPLTVQDDSFYFGAQPGAALEYSINTEPADTAPGLYVLSGSAINLQYQVTNTGNVLLTNLIVMENAKTICTIEHLAEGASQTCQRSAIAQTGEISAAATVTADPPSPLKSVTASDPMFYFGAAPEMTLIVKTNNQDGATDPGVYVPEDSTVNWTYTVTNTGNVPLSHVVVVDDSGTPANLADDRTPASCKDVSLAIGANVTCTLSGKAQAGQYTNSALATSSPPDPLTAITASDTSHYFGVALNVTLSMQTNGQDAETSPGPLIGVGAPVNWTYAVANSSNVAVGISIVDDNGTPAYFPDDAILCDSQLAAGGQKTCSRSGSAIAGQYANTARVTIIPPGGLNPSTVQDISHYFGAAPAVEIIKYTNGIDANEAPGLYIHAGDPVAWTYTVTNTGNVPLTQVMVTDDQGVDVTCPAAALEPAAAMTCTGSGVAAYGLYHNIGTVTANPPPGFTQATDSDPSYYVGTNASVSIEKRVNGEHVTGPPGPDIYVGQPVSWSYLVTNTGNITLNHLAVTDDQGLTVSCPVSTLAPGAQTTCTAAGKATTVGPYTNLGTVSAQPGGENGLIYASDSSYYFGVPVGRTFLPLIRH